LVATPRTVPTLADAAEGRTRRTQQRQSINAKRRSAVMPDVLRWATVALLFAHKLIHL
jgi:hypothetical protein